MTKIFTFPCGNAVIADSPREAAEKLKSFFPEANTDIESESEEKGDEEFEALYGELEKHGETVTGNPETLETFGPELLKVLALHVKEPNRIWTIVDCDDGLSRLVAGLQRVNAINYATSAKPWQDESEIYLWG